MPGFEAITWFGMLAPRGTPGEIVTRLSDELRKIGQTPQIRNLLLSQGADPVSNTPAEFRAYLHSELAKWAKVARAMPAGKAPAVGAAAWPAGDCASTVQPTATNPAARTSRRTIANIEAGIVFIVMPP